MPFQNIYELYNDVLAADKPFVDTCITEIKTEIETRTTANTDFFFDYDATTALSSVPDLNKMRILDQVQFILRSIGIRCTFNVSGVTSLNSYSFILHIEWFIRNRREFMKTYY
ncbi:MAG: hypothetical protein ABIP51_05070 [Bacteroidia bacterium]